FPPAGWPCPGIEHAPRSLRRLAAVARHPGSPRAAPTMRQPAGPRGCPDRYRRAGAGRAARRRPGAAPRPGRGRSAPPPLGTSDSATRGARLVSSFLPNGGAGVEISGREIVGARREPGVDLVGRPPAGEAERPLLALHDVVLVVPERPEPRDAPACHVEPPAHELERQRGHWMTEAFEDLRFEALHVDLAEPGHAVLADEGVQRGDAHVHRGLPPHVAEARIPFAHPPLPAVGERRDG